MKIISNKKDYYDNINSSFKEDTDEKTIIYNRTTEFVENINFVSNISSKRNEKAAEFNDLSNLISKKLEIKGISLENIQEIKLDNNFIASPNLIIFAGKAYITFSIGKNTGCNFKDFVEAKLVKQEDISKESYKDYFINYFSSSNNIFSNIDNYHDYYKKYFEMLKEISTIDFSDELYKLNIPILTYRKIINKNNSLLPHFYFVKNDNVGQLGLQKLLDPYSANQELEIFLSQQLNNSLKINEPSNELKIINHGFDLKQSFRKRPK